MRLRLAACAVSVLAVQPSIDKAGRCAGTVASLAVHATASMQWPLQTSLLAGARATEWHFWLWVHLLQLRVLAGKLHHARRVAF